MTLIHNIKDTENHKEFRILSIYQSCAVPLPKCVTTWLLQVTFLVFVLMQLWSHPVSMTPMARTFWAIAPLLQRCLTLSDPTTKSEYNSGKIESTLRWVFRMEFHDKPSLEHWKEQMDSGYMATLLRLFFHYSVNGVMEAVIIYSLPVLLAASSDPLELVMNATAITYIVKLDDCATTETHDHKEKLKASLPGSRDVACEERIESDSSHAQLLG